MMINPLPGAARLTAAMLATVALLTGCVTSDPSTGHNTAALPLAAASPTTTSDDWTLAGVSGALDYTPPKRVAKAFSTKDATDALRTALAFTSLRGYNSALASDENLTVEQALASIADYLTPRAQTKAAVLFTTMAKVRDRCAEVGNDTDKCLKTMNGHAKGLRFNVEDLLDGYTLTSLMPTPPMNVTYSDFGWKVLKTRLHNPGDGAIEGISFGLRTSAKATGSLTYAGKTHRFTPRDPDVYAIHWLHMVPNTDPAAPTDRPWLIDDFTMGFPTLINDGTVGRTIPINLQ